MTTDDPDLLIHGRLDGTLAPAEQAKLNEWIKSDPAHADRFAAAVRLHNQIYSQYQLLNAALAQIDKVQIEAAPHKKKTSHRWVIGGGVVCLLLAGLFYLSWPSHDERTAVAISELRQLVKQARQPADRVFRVTFVKEKPPENAAKDAKNGAKPRGDAASSSNEALLYVRDARQFVFVWTSLDGRRSMIGSDGKISWAIRTDGEVEMCDDPMHFTATLPGEAGKYLVPILNCFEGQEKVLIADYHLELRHPTKSTDMIMAGKKPDTKQGPRRIELTYAPSSREVSEMRIFPEIPDRRRVEYTLLTLVGTESLPPAWFTWESHSPPGKVPIISPPVIPG